MEYAEEQMQEGGEGYVALPQKAPSISLLDALDATLGLESPFIAREINAVCVMRDYKKCKPMAFWAVTLNDKPPFSIHDPRLIPESQRNHVRVLVDATSGKILFSTTCPQTERLR